MILDATFAQRAHREQFKTHFASQGIRFRVLEAQADDDTVKQRLQAREARPDQVSDARLEDFEMLTRLYEPPRELAGSRLLAVSTIASLETTLALKALVQAQVESPCLSP